jgi:hypothetical protein
MFRAVESPIESEMAVKTQLACPRLLALLGAVGLGIMLRVGGISLLPHVIGGKPFGEAERGTLLWPIAFYPHLERLP